MKKELIIRGGLYDMDEIYIPNVCYIRLDKITEHRYSYSLFFYEYFFISQRDFIRSKKKLYIDVQNLCDIYLNHLV